ncbi:hypothetical protein [Halorussus halophilus]|uniref:hypothetical protein n=1 Tax=Halorussus halophilus TaxID=2650975 RepID=UPI0013010D12|nr:hypothetical protein [Halorussus halophilus]
MATDTEGAERDRSSLRTLVLLAVTFAVGYVLGARGGDDADWDGGQREPTEITIDESGTTDEKTTSESGSEATESRSGSEATESRSGSEATENTAENEESSESEK